MYIHNYIYGCVVVKTNSLVLIGCRLQITLKHSMSSHLGSADQIQLLQNLCRVINAKKTLDIGKAIFVSCITLSVLLCFTFRYTGSRFMKNMQYTVCAVHTRNVQYMVYAVHTRNMQNTVYVFYTLNMQYIIYAVHRRNMYCTASTVYIIHVQYIVLKL